MNTKVAIKRIVPNIYSSNLKISKEFYKDFLEMELVMDLGWIITFSSKQYATAQINIFQYEGLEKPDNKQVFISIEVADVAEMHKRAIKMGVPIVYPLQNESWGVRRFFVKDPNGVTINLLAHLIKER